jgi:hypothetical protein
VNFDVTMGSFDGAETCELVGLYLLSQMQHLNIDLGLYRDDGLAASSLSPRQTEHTKKEICKIFKNNNLKITIEANLKVVDFLDITLDLGTELYKPFNKPNSTPLYINKQSNHPPSILKNIPVAVNRRLSVISANADVFNEAAPLYQNALKDSGYEHKLEYKPVPDNNNTIRRSRKRNITWFNPPYSSNISTNIGTKFLKLIESSFPPSHKLHQIINKNTVKISYRCTSNIKQVISRHNSKLMKEQNPQQRPVKKCNCRGDKTCPLDGSCLSAGIIYKATVVRPDKTDTESYIGLTDDPFKTRYANHTASFKHTSKRSSTALSNYIWQLKDKNIQHNITWKIITKSKSFSPSTNTCQLCLKEKFYIIFKPEMATLNTRNELASSCRHKKKFLLVNSKN